MEKMISLKLREISGFKEAGKILAWTNGCFDLLHAGHVEALSEAKRMAWEAEAYHDKGSTTGTVEAIRLIVGINDDQGARALKGSNRPIYPLSQRMKMVEAIKGVDLVIPIIGVDPYPLIAEIKPKWIVKGSDYRGSEVVGRDIAEKEGGRVLFNNLCSGLSTTETIRCIAQRYTVPTSMPDGAATLERDTLCSKEAASILNVSVKQLESMVRKREVPGVKVGHSFLFSARALVQWLREKGIMEVVGGTESGKRSGVDATGGLSG